MRRHKHTIYEYLFSYFHKCYSKNISYNLNHWFSRSCFRSTFLLGVMNFEWKNWVLFNKILLKISKFDYNIMYSLVLLMFSFLLLNSDSNKISQSFTSNQIQWNKAKNEFCREELMNDRKSVISRCEWIWPNQVQNYLILIFIFKMLYTIQIELKYCNILFIFFFLQIKVEK
jgi:hypothetical protein